MIIHILDNNVFQDIVDCGSINLVPIQAFTDFEDAKMRLMEMIQKRFPADCNEFLLHAEKQEAMNNWPLCPEYYDEFIETKYDALESECIYEVEVQ